MARTFALEPAVRGPVAYDPVVTHGAAPPALAAALYHFDDLTTPVATLERSRNRRWQDQLNEVGSGSIVLQNDDPDLAEVADNDIVRFVLHGYTAFAFQVREREQVTIDTGEEAAQATTLTGPGLLALLDSAVVYPSRGVGSKPIEEDRVFSWPSVDYDDSGWGYAAAIGAAYGNTTPAWYGIASAWPPDGAQFIWAAPGSEVLAPGGPCYFRSSFTVGTATDAVVYFACDDFGELWLDGQKIREHPQWMNSDSDVVTEPVSLDAGTHVLAGMVTNSTDGPATIDPWGDFNPAMFAVSVLPVDPLGTVLATPLVVTDTSWRVLAYPPYPPGMTPGEVLRHVIAEAQARGALTGVTLNFTDEVDSDGVPWPEVGDIATKVGTDVWTFTRELTATYLDVWMEPGALRLWAWVRDGRGDDRAVTFHAPTDGTDPASGNLVRLTHKQAL